jgi:hypothetical protein
MIISAWMVENGHGMEKPGMLDSIPQTPDNIVKTILRMRALDVWNWAAEYNWVYEYTKGKSSTQNILGRDEEGKGIPWAVSYQRNSLR